MDTTDTTTDPIAALKSVQASYLRDGFNQAPLTGFVTTFGIKVDCKQSDVSLLTMLYNRLLQTGATSTELMDYNNVSQTVTVIELGQIISEMTDYGLSVYAHKWAQAAALAAATTAEEVQAVVW